MKPWLWPIICFCVVAALGYGAHHAIGSVYSSGEAIGLIESLSRSGLYLGSASATASATTLALMLTLIGMVRRSDHDFDTLIYQNIARIAKLATASLMISLLLLLTLVFPVGEFESLPGGWYEALYRIMFALVIAVVGLLSATVALLYLTVMQVLRQITPGEEL